MHQPITDSKPLTAFTDYGPRDLASSPNHAGIDWSPISGGRVEVFAPFTGYVSRIVRGRERGDTSSENSLRPGVTGNGLTITDDGEGKFNYTTALLGHVDVLPGIELGDRVREGQLIGYTDLSGNTDGHHVHLELHHGQRATSSTHFDPLPLFEAAGIAPGVIPVVPPEDTEEGMPGMFITRKGRTAYVLIRESRADGISREAAELMRDELGVKIVSLPMDDIVALQKTPTVDDINN